LTPQSTQALDQYNQVLKADHSNIYAANGLGAVLAELGKLQEAKDIFTEVQVGGFGTPSLDHFGTALHPDSQSFNDLPPRVQAYPERTCVLLFPFRTSIDRPPSLVWSQAAAASSNGLINIPDLYINLANVSLASQDYTDALRLYKVAMGKLDANKQSQVLLYLARGHYDSDDLKTAKMYLLRAIHIAPTDYKLRFNAALTMQASLGGCPL